MTIFSQLLGTLAGGFGGSPSSWRTVGSGGMTGAGAFDSPDSMYDNVNPETAQRLSAVWSCMNIRAETIGAMPLHLRDGDKKVLRTHDLYNILHRSPNADQTAAEYWSMVVGQIDMLGNSVSIIERGVGKKVVALTPVDISKATVSVNTNRSGSRKTWKIGNDDFKDDDILHLRGFTLDGMWGTPRLDIGRQIMAAQLQANRSAMLAFKQGLKVGGFILNKGKRNFTTEEMQQISGRFSEHSKPENAHKWMHLLMGMEPIGGSEFNVKPAEAQLLESRYFGIEEICRVFNVPPPLIGHTSKASSWASSLENLNLHFLLYSLQPTIVRIEQRIEKKLLTPYDIAEGAQAKFSMQGLLRGDMKSRQAFYTSGLQNGYLCQDEVRDFEDMPELPNGEGKVYRVQLNMQQSDTDAAATAPTGEAA